MYCMGVQIPPWKGVILRVKYRHSAVICAKTDEPIEMPFELKARIGPRNRVIDGVQRCGRCHGNQFWDAICCNWLRVNDGD